MITARGVQALERQQRSQVPRVTIEHGSITINRLRRVAEFVTPHFAHAQVRFDLQSGVCCRLGLALQLFH